MITLHLSMFIVIAMAALLWGMSIGVIVMLMWFKQRDRRLGILSGNDARRFVTQMKVNESQKIPEADYLRAKKIFDDVNRNNS
jgi:hypothetical protein